MEAVIVNKDLIGPMLGDGEIRSRLCDLVSWLATPLEPRYDNKLWIDFVRKYVESISVMVMV